MLPINVTDADNDTVDLTVNWGDGSAAEAVNNVAGALQVQHTYTTTGNHTITFTANDGYENRSLTSTVNFITLPTQISNIGGYYNWRPECSGVFASADYPYVYYLSMDPNAFTGLNVDPKTLSFEMARNGTTLTGYPVLQAIDTVPDPINGLNFDKADSSLVLKSQIPAGSGEGSYVIRNVQLIYRPNSVSEEVHIPVTVPETARFDAIGALSVTGMNYVESLQLPVAHLTASGAQVPTIFNFSNIVVINKNSTETVTGHFRFDTNHELNLYRTDPVKPDDTSAAKVARDGNTSTTYIEHKIETQFVEAGGTGEWIESTANIDSIGQDANGNYQYETVTAPFSNAAMYQDKPVGDYTMKVRIQSYKVVRNNTDGTIISEEPASSDCLGFVQGELMVQLVDEVINAVPETLDTEMYGQSSQQILLNLPRLNKTTTQMNPDYDPAIPGSPFLIQEDPDGHPLKAYQNISIVVYAANDMDFTTPLARSVNSDSFVPADFDSTQKEQHLMKLDTALPQGLYTIKFEEHKIIYTVDGNGNIIPLGDPLVGEPKFAEWTNTPQFTVGTVNPTPVVFTPRVLNRLVDKDENGNLIKQFTITDSTGHFTGTGNRYLRIVKVDGTTETEVYPPNLH